MSSRTIPIAFFTFQQCLRQPLYLILTLTALTLIGSHPLIAIFTFEDHLKLVVDGCLATLLGCGWLIGVFSASHCLNQDLATEAITLVMAKPVGKFDYFTGKQLGLLAALGWYFLLAAISILVALRMARAQFDIDRVLVLTYFGGLILACIWGVIRNYFASKSYASSTLSGISCFLLGLAFYLFISPQDHFPGDEEPRIATWAIIKTMMLLLMPILTMGIIAAVASLRCNLAMNLGVCGIIFGLGLVSDYFFANAGNHGMMQWVHALIPNWQLFWLTDALAIHREIPTSYLLAAGSYGLFLILQFNLLAWLLFAHREIGLPARH